ALGDDLPLPDRLERVSQIEHEERERGTRRAVAGFDLTFSVPKSVSVLWALADGGTQAIIARAHYAALRDVLDLMEREVAATRVGADASDGSVAHMDVTGFVATAYDHFDSRATDPQLHTHVVVANKVRAVHDGRWRTLAGRPIHQSVVAMSEHYNAVLADRLARDLGLVWESRDRGERRNPAFELAAVPEALISEFSRRSHDIEARADELIAAWRERHGRAPSKRTILRLRAEATLTTRPEKLLHSLAELTEGWRARAEPHLGSDPAAWAGSVIAPYAQAPTIRTDDVPLQTIEDVAVTVVMAVSEKRATWRRWNLHAEASRQTIAWRFASTQDREAVVGMIADAAQSRSLALTPPEVALTPEIYRRQDGTSMFRPRHATVFSSTVILEAEDRLLVLGRDRSGPAVRMEHVGRAVRRALPGGKHLSTEQARAVQSVACSGRVIDVLVGPAGTGKTTTLAGLRAAWERQHGPDSVIGLAPSAAAAEVLAGDLGISTENTAKWTHDHVKAGLTLRRGQLVIVDEASLAGTLMLDGLAAHAAEVGAKLLLAGDPMQLDSVDAGGAFALLVADRDDAPTLLEVRRFHNAWERSASLRLRLGDAAALNAYAEHGRLRGGEQDEVTEALYAAWSADIAAGKRSLMIAESTESVTELNLRARVDRIRSGAVDPADAVRISDGMEASQGDLILTRQNDRRLAVGRGFVKNGDHWIVVAAHRDGSLTVRQNRRRAWEVRLPAWYVSEHVELGYAMTVHRSQGATVDTAHLLVDPARTSRESLYVGLTRATDANTAYVVTDAAATEEHQHPVETPSAREVLVDVLARVVAEPSAHVAIRAEQDAWTGIGQIAAEYDTIATTALVDRYLDLLGRAGVSAAQLDDLTQLESFAPLVSELRRLEADRHDLGVLLPQVVAERPLDDAADVGAVLYRRLQRPFGAGRPRRPPRLIAGLIPAAVGIADAEMRQALDERRDLIERRAATLADAALRERAGWTRGLGRRPADPARANAWLGAVRTIAAYRDRYRIADDRPAGPPAASVAQRLDQARAEAAIRAAQRIAADDTRPRRQQDAAGRRVAGPTL
ncbi:MAG: conjugal transfer protein, partial [Microbacterium sp.]|nr:conjugal transfer protein [Microbacterium sp.]